MTLSYPPPFQDLKTLAAHVSMSEHTIENLVKQGTFPAPRKNKCGKRLWVWKEVEAWLAAPDDDAPANELDRIREATRRLSHG